MNDMWRSRSITSLSLLTLFTTTGSLLCCALPILLVSLGLGTVIIAVTSSFPALIMLSQYKAWIFILSGSLLALTAWLIWRSRHQCPTNIEAAMACRTAQKWNQIIWLVSITIWCLGFFSSYFALPIWQWLEI